MEDQTDIFLKVVIPILTFVMGFLASRFTMTKKERKDYNAKLQENSNSLLRSLDDQFQKFTLALKEYSSKSGTPTLNEFFTISTTGEGYFLQMKMICDSILSGNIDRQSVLNTHIQIIKEAVEKSLPAYYKTLQEIAEVQDLEYSGELSEDNYQSIYTVYDKYCK
jgi:hypothetical protein